MMIRTTFTEGRRWHRRFRVQVIAPYSSVVEVQVILFFITGPQSVVFAHNPVEVLWIFTKGPLKLKVPLLTVMLFTSPLKVGCATDLKLLVG
jgi:hypothetical protein